MTKKFYCRFQLRMFLLTNILAAITVGCKSDSPASTPIYNIPTSSGEGAIGPEMALSTFEVAPGFQIELIASEPLVSDPVDIAIDEYGRLFVIEMHGYPLDKSGTGKIKMLTDTNGDGKMDEATTFADGLIMPFGMMRWKKGLIVADAPDILYLEDTNGDGKSDIRQIMLTGFAFSNAQMNAGNPIYGMDNWIYLTSEAPGAYQIYNEKFGYMGEEIHFPGHPDAPRLPQRPGRTVRFQPDTFQLEFTSGMTQFGHDFDDWGHHILGNNSNHLYHEVIAAPYLERNPDLLVSNVTQTLSDHGSEVFSITKNPERQLLTSDGVFTSASGNTAYTGASFPAPFNNAFFVAESVSNIVHVDFLEDKGASFVASRPRPDEEFLASTDAWFRPVNMYSGPDGAIYVLDYYRQIIEHPEWMSKEAIEAGELYNGVDMGRIYRITPKGTEPAAWMNNLRLGDATNKVLVEELANPNGWWRMNAQRLLVDRADEKVIPDLVRMTGNPDSPMGRLHALWTLEGLGELDPQLIQKALTDSVAGIRKNAVRLAELHLSTTPALVKDLLDLQDDSDAKVRFQLLLTLGFLDTPEAAKVRNDLLFGDINDPWFQIAALSASSSQAESLLTMVFNNFKIEVPAYTSLVEKLSAMVGANGAPATIRQLINKAVNQNQDWSAAVPVLEGLSRGLNDGSLVTEQEQNLLVEAFFGHPSEGVRNASLEVLKVTGIKDSTGSKAAIEKALSIIKNPKLSEEKRTEAINFIVLYDPASYAELLKELILPHEEVSVQLAALNVLSRIPGLTVSDFVLQQWPNFSPGTRAAALNTFLPSKDRVRLLLDAIETGGVQQSDVSFPISVRLMTGYGEELSSRARKIFTSGKEGKTNEEYQKALKLQGDVISGKAIYQQNCAVCHVKGEIGTDFGPNLGTVQSWNAEAIMAHILDPNISIAAGYDLWNITLKDGKTIGGIISSETSSAITLKNAGGVEVTVDRQDIMSLQALNMSAMPAGWENQINPQQMADLLEYLRQSQ